MQEQQIISSQLCKCGHVEYSHIYNPQGYNQQGNLCMEVNCSCHLFIPAAIGYKPAADWRDLLSDGRRYFLNASRAESLEDRRKWISMALECGRQAKDLC